MGTALALDSFQPEPKSALGGCGVGFRPAPGVPGDTPPPGRPPSQPVLLGPGGGGRNCRLVPEVSPGETAARRLRR
ncbi:hypothetical protein H920_15081 [Fukomys damarensis]|uniref:Uncharacterized protein n=1 Tax=Fukomys damarensis TaxID=885580 RepID=A0A091CV79_FUKDA|nr:hypothetical protein H920_15081 [Fukomys damarensis]